MEITILYEAPAILTKDSEWLRQNKPTLKQGSIVLLPKDAVLVCPPTTMQIVTNLKKDNN